MSNNVGSVGDDLLLLTLGNEVVFKIFSVKCRTKKAKANNTINEIRYKWINRNTLSKTISIFIYFNQLNWYESVSGSADAK